MIVEHVQFSLPQCGWCGMDIVVEGKKKKKKKKKVPLQGFKPRLSVLLAQAHYFQTTWKVLIGENCIIQVSP